MAFSAAPYLRRVYYYETDKMGIVHHSNYIRWMEEARIDYMRQAELSYEDVEKLGILMPVVDVSCRFRVSARFGDEVAVLARMTEFNGVRARFTYELRLSGPEGRLLAEGESGHCFVDAKTMQPLSMKRRDPAFYGKALSLLGD